MIRTVRPSPWSFAHGIVIAQSEPEAQVLLDRRNANFATDALITTHAAQVEQLGCNPDRHA